MAIRVLLIIAALSASLIAQVTQIPASSSGGTTGFTAGAGTLTGPAVSGTVSTTAGANVIPQAGAGGTISASFVPTLNQNTTGTAGGLSANITESQVTSLVSDLAGKMANPMNAADQIIGSGSSSGGTPSALGLSNCPTGGLQYSTSSHTFSCGTFAGLGANSFTDIQTITKTNLGTTSTDGAVLTNTTAAAAGVQQYSPRIHWTGQGWKTTATAASQTLDWIAEIQPIQSTAAPTNALVFSSQANAGGYSPLLQIVADGANAPGTPDRVQIWESSASVRGVWASGFFTGGGVLTPGSSHPTTDGGAMINGSNFFTRGDSGVIGWASGTDPAGTIDTTLQRDSAGTVAVTFGSHTTTAANYRDIKSRNNILVGTTTTYNNVSTAGIGVPPVYASVSLTGQTASISSTNLQCGGAVCAAGLYRVKGYEVVTTTGSGTISTTIGWNDATASRTSATAGVSTGATNFESIDVVLKADGVNNITYSTTLSSSGTYALYLTLERLQ